VHLQKEPCGIKKDPKKTLENPKKSLIRDPSIKLKKGKTKWKTLEKIK